MQIAYLGCKGLPSKSGVERVVEAIVTRTREKHAVTVYADARYTSKETRVEGVRIIRVPTLKGKFTQATTLFLLSAIHALFCRYDLIHLHGVDASFILPILRLKYRVVSTSHGTLTRVNRVKWGGIARSIIIKMEYPFVFLSNIATSVSMEDAVYMQERYKKEITYIPNGVGGDIPCDSEKAEQELRQIGLEPGNFLMFAAGRIDPTKGCHVLLEALKRMDFQPKVLIVGDLNQVPSYRDHLRETARGLPVTFLPPIADRSLLFGMIRQARLFIFPSISEAMSMMLLEAASLGAPVICSDIPENQTALRENVLYFRSEEPADLTEKIAHALGHPQEMSHMGQQAAAYVMENLTWDSIVEQYEKIYEACTHETR